MPVEALIATAAALLTWPPPSAAVRPGTSRSDTSRFGRRRAGLPTGGRAVVAGLISALTTGALLPGALLVPLVIGAAAAVSVRLAAGSATGGDPQAAADRLALLCELWAAALMAGTASVSALRAALIAAGPAPVVGPAETQLRRAAGLLVVGADPVTTWRSVTAPELAPLAAAAARSATGGTELAAAVRETADGIRAVQSSTAQRAAARAGVLMAAPLAVCFLPGFLCLGVAPVVLGLVGRITVIP